MYASESAGERYPRIQMDASFGSAATAFGCDPDTVSDSSVFAPNTRALVPEYLPDADVLICPSDPGAGDKNPLKEVEDDGSDTCRFVGELTNADESYNYLGYVFDKVDDTDPAVTVPFPGPTQLVGFTISIVGSLFNMDPSDDDVADGDIDLSAVGFGGLDAGNGEGDVILRLREGVERFLITDINNVNTSSVGQTDVPIMWDTISTIPVGGGVDFNHLPGGANVLYLDGHADFLRYPNVFPATESFAILASQF